MMEPIVIKTRDEEAKIQEKIIGELSRLGWFCMETHGNLYQRGFPDVFCTHYRYGMRWLEVKKPVGYQFTSAQLEFFPKLVAHGCGIWIATTHVGVQELLMKPHNWHWYLMKTRSSHGQT